MTSSNKKNKFNFIDLYSGIGGFKYALDKKGGNCVFSAEINKHAIETYEYNHKNIEHSANFSMDTFKDMKTSEIKKMKQFENVEIDLITAGFPCQTFSVAGKREGFNSDDTRGTQFFNVMNLVKGLKPKVVLLENVKHLVSHDNGKTYKVILDSLNEAGYNVKLKEVISPLEVGVPQNRERIFIIALRKDIKQELKKLDINRIINKNNFITNKDIRDKEADEFYGIELSKEQELAVKTWEGFVNKWFSKKDSFEKTIPALWLDEMFEQKNPIKIDMPEWKKIMIKRMIDFKEKHNDWIVEWYNKNKEKFSKRIHAKLEWNAGDAFKPRETIAVIRQSGVRFKKPNFYPALVAVVDIPIIFDLNIKKWRNISFEEMKRLQSFDEYKFKKPENMRFEEVYKQLGNSVNIKVVEKVIETLEGILW